MAAPRSTPVPFLLTLAFAAGLGFGYFVFHEEKSKTYLAPPLEVKAAPLVSAKSERSERTTMS